MIFSKHPKVSAAAAFYDGNGDFKCSGPLSALPFNPHPYDRCPQFRVGFNGKWILCDLLDASDTYGWVAVAAPDWNTPSVDHTPKVTLQRNP